ncbi:MAG: hypothetical protein JOZ36_04640, partial [Acidobacteria bacterium]|nr:hypothetical protein [Acidobacteriota bacterium]
MYTGTLIEQLMAAVEHVEKLQRQRETAELERLYLAVSAKPTMRSEPKLV